MIRGGDSTLPPVSNRLPYMMLDALEQIALQAREQPIDRSKAIAAILAYLYSLQRCERWPFDGFWKALDQPDEKTRSSNLNSTLNGICLQVGVDRLEKRQALSKADISVVPAIVPMTDNGHPSA